MRFLVLVLVLLAGGKIYIQDRLYRSAAEDAIIAAYRERALEACQREASESKKPRAAPSSGWAKPGAIELVVGKRDLDVPFWEVESPHWKVRYKQLFLTVRPGDQQSGVCTYDIAGGGAQISQL